MTTQSKTATDLFEEACKSNEQALKTGTAVQEDTVRIWKDLLSKTTAPGDFQAKFTEMAENVFPTAKKRMGEALRTVEQNFKSSADLLQQAMETCQPGTMADTQNTLRRLWESSLAAS